ncbi:ubiquitin hydrolase B-like [Trichomycterus rosablanca]|uniref:ubiquitin hydrolase B-like n=1 Tax=Trichomycterus rosablanca TaxID=2290929 RepID=UPI002F35179B
MYNHMCGAEKRRTEDYNHLSLALVENGSVKDCLEFFFRDEEEIECRCVVCNCTSASCRWTFYSLPRYLVLQLKRFKLSAKLKLRKQLNSVKIDRKLQLRLPGQSDLTQEDIINKTMDTDLTSTEYRKAEERTDRHEVDQCASYSLISVLNHYGSTIHSGHYTCDCFNQTDHLWLSYDDDEVSLTTEEYILNKRQKSAYVLIYELL